MSARKFNKYATFHFAVSAKIIIFTSCIDETAVMNLDNFLNILKIDSSSGKERRLAEYCAYGFATGKSVSEIYEVGDGTLNVYLKWGNPRIVFCTHLDTVPPYIPPKVENLPDGDVKISGRGSCDAKGQIFSMYNACIELENEGYTDFGLLLVSGEETGSKGARTVDSQIPGGEYLVVGEPTDSKMVTAGKGTKAFFVSIKGKSAHSGYPENGDSAVMRFVDFMKRLAEVRFPEDPVLGKTTYNVGELESPNSQNILSDRLTFRIYFRTTFASDEAVCRVMADFADDNIEVKAFGGDTPSQYMTLDGFETKTVAFGNDAPHINNFSHKMLCGPGSILVAHTDDEHILLSDLRRAKDNYVTIYKRLEGRKAGK